MENSLLFSMVRKILFTVPMNSILRVLCFQIQIRRCIWRCLLFQIFPIALYIFKSEFLLWKEIISSFFLLNVDVLSIFCALWYKWCMTESMTVSFDQPLYHLMDLFLVREYRSLLYFGTFICKYVGEWNGKRGWKRKYLKLFRKPSRLALPLG